MDSSSVNLFDLQIDHQANSSLREAARWARFLGIIGFIFCGLGVIFSIFGGSLIAQMMTSTSDAAAYSTGIGIFFTIFYLLFCAIYFFPCFYLFNFGAKMKRALDSNDVESLNSSFRNLKSCFRFVGILSIIFLGFFLLGILAQVATYASLS